MATRKESNKLLATQASALSAEPTGPSTSTTSLSLRSCVLSSIIPAECSAKGALRSHASGFGKPSGDERGRVDEFASSAMLGPDLGQELIQMCCDQAGGLVQGSLRRSHDERHSKHRVREVLGGERDDEVAQLPVGVLLRISVCEGQRQSAQEEGTV
jgi:hypothetical protein